MVEFFLASLTWPAIAVTASRTLANVKSSAMRPRQPEVPNFIGDEGEVEGDGVMARYSSAEAVGKNSWGDAVVGGGRPMVRGTGKRVVLVTCGSMKEARKIARGVVGKRLAGCVNIGMAAVESVYWWKGKVETGKEFLLVMKTTASRLSGLEKEVKRLHSYDVPEFVALEIAAGSKEYLRWVEESVE